MAPVAEYKLYVSQGVDKLVKDTKAFTDAVKAGDLAKAKALYAPTRFSYEMIEPVAELFSDLDGKIDSRADDHEKAEKYFRRAIEKNPKNIEAARELRLIEMRRGGDKKSGSFFDKLRAKPASPK